MSEIDRRGFLKLVGVGAGATAAAGCSDHVEKLIPYVIQPEEITPGISVFYASTCQECPAGCGLHVNTREGRPIKLEGNPDHPVNRGSLCARGQAGIERTYHPDRFHSPMLRGVDGRLAPITWAEATALLAQKLRAAGARAHVLGGSTGPTLSALIDQWVAAVGAGGRVRYDTFGCEALCEATRAVFGVDARPAFSLEGADFIIDFGSDFLEGWLSPVEFGRQLAAARDILRNPNGGARFVYVGPRLSLTGDNADEWLPARPGSEGILALGIAREVYDRRGEGAPELRSVLAGFDADSVAQKTGVPAATIRRVGRAIAAASAPVALPPGVGLTSRRATATQAAVLILNSVAGAVGTNVLLPEGAPAPSGSFRDVAKLIAAMKSGDVSVLLIHGANPVYSLPTDAGFAEALGSVDFVVSTASMPDETSEMAHLILPDNTPLESWGDSAPRPGVRSLVQPTVRPLYDTQSLGDTLLQTARALGEEAAAALPAGSFRGVLESAWADTDWRQALARGGVFGAPTSAPVSLAAGVGRLEFVEPELEGSGAFTLLPNVSPLLGDGGAANLGWVQETPDPVTSVCWQSWAEISRGAAERLGVDTGDLLSITTPYGTLEVPAFPRGGIRDDVVAVATGQGHTVGLYASLDHEGRPGEARGVNVIDALPALTDETGGRAWLTTRADVAATGRHRRIPLTQFTDNKRGRQLGDAIPLAALAAAGEGGAEPAGAAEHGGGHAGAHGGAHAESHEIREPYDPTKDSVADNPYRWGMTIDLDRCTGCSACVVACAIENNIPLVGEEGVQRHRQMTWLRIERYIGGGDQELRSGRPSRIDHEELGKLDVRHSPMMCQQCGAAPCEPVCPVIATYHADDGLNAMTYNRCIGTRYCSNNCPYKVRRFNWFDYGIEAWPEPTRLRLNPDVTVRGQGVMEKCTFCVQRIAGARQLAKDLGRPIADGEAVPACAQTCPTTAITFGNLKDQTSEVVTKAAANEKRAYHALHVLNTRPATTYLKKVMRGEGEA